MSNDFTVGQEVYFIPSTYRGGESRGRYVKVKRIGRKYIWLDFGGWGDYYILRHTREFGRGLAVNVYSKDHYEAGYVWKSMEAYTRVNEIRAMWVKLEFILRKSNEHSHSYETLAAVLKLMEEEDAKNTGEEGKGSGCC